MFFRANNPCHFTTCENCNIPSCIDWISKAGESQVPFTKVHIETSSLLLRTHSEVTPPFIRSFVFTSILPCLWKVRFCQNINFYVKSHFPRQHLAFTSAKFHSTIRCFVMKVESQLKNQDRNWGLDLACKFLKLKLHYFKCLHLKFCTTLTCTREGLDLTTLQRAFNLKHHLT